MGDKEADSGQRRELRVEVALQIRFACIEDLEDMIKAKTLNLSKGGMFICTERLRKKGHRVEIEISVPGSEPVTIKGTIRHARLMDGQPFGIGIEFDELKDPALQVIDEIINKTDKQET